MSTSNHHFQVRQMTKEDLKIALSWAASEGWNPGIDDADNLYISDPHGFLIGELNGQPISSISLVKYNFHFNFIGLYLVKPEARNKGYGLKTWQEAMKLINHEILALDAVLKQVHNYQKFGFKSAHSHIRYQGKISGKISADLQDVKNINFEQLCRYDRQYFPGDRPHFLANWIQQPQGQGYALINDHGDLIGYGVIRKATEGYRIGPLFAENQNLAKKLLLGLADFAQGSNIYLDVPNINQKAITLLENYHLKPIQENIRMYTAPPPYLNWQNIFAVTTLGIG
jgi:GNAT superfamily N-acetyltransferase